RPPVSRDAWYQRVYGRIIGVTLRWPWVTVVLAIVILGGSWRLFDKHVTRGVLWGSWGGQSSYISIQIRLPRGEELQQTDELARFFEDRLAVMPEVERFTTRVQPQYAFIRVDFPDALDNSPIPPAIKEQMLAYSYQFGGAEVRVFGYGPSFYGGGVSPPNYNIKVLGYNYEEVRRIAEDIGRRVERFSRVRDVDVNSTTGFAQRDRASEYVLDLDRARLGLHGLTASEVVGFVGAAVGGRMQNQGNVIRVGGEEVQYAITFAGNRDVDLLELENLLIPAPGGTGVRLANVATLRQRDVLARIVRENQQYQRVVSYEFRGPTRLGDRIRDAVIEATTLPDGYAIEKADTWRWNVEEQEAIWKMLMVSLILIYMVTAALFESMRQPLVVLLTVPMALVGVFLMFFYSNATFTREAWIGVIMMSGIVVNNAILLIDHINQLRRRDGVPFLDAVKQGTIERVRPILMTSATTIFGLLPLVLFADSVDTNIWNALGLALIGGLASSTLFVLTVTPAVYLIFERRKARRMEAAKLAVAAP
ncbi:MAG: efflux RND transporter permease subunit, partial [Gemmatimonadales bacterium]